MKSAFIIVITVIFIASPTISQIVQFDLPTLQLYEADGDNREFLSLHNTSDSVTSYLRMNFNIGTSAINNSKGDIMLFGDKYHVIPYRGYFTLTGRDQGVIIRANSGGGNIRLVTGGNDLDTRTTMFLSNLGTVGIGNSDPKAKLHLKDGDFYMENSAIIMKDLNGNCHALFVSNNSELQVQSTSCP